MQLCKVIMSVATEYYNYLHTIPEEGFLEEKTATFLEQELKTMGYEVIAKVDGKTGLVGILDSGVEGPVVAFRSDIDALGHVIDGVHVSRHTCGHDGHMSMLLAAAKEIKEKNLVKKGKLKLLFQPAEELGTGALSMIAGGVIDDLDWAFGAHVRPFEEVQNGQASSAIHYAASCRMIVTFHGTPAHGARPHLGVNAIDAATAAVVAVNAIHLKPTENYSVKATRFLCDSGVTNAIPDKAVVTWDLRAQHNDTMQELCEKFVPAVTAAAATVGATVTIDDSQRCHAAILDKEATALLVETICDVLGPENLVDEIYTPGSEDFFFYNMANPRLKSGFFGLGCDLRPGLHHPDMHFDVSALDNGVKIWTALCTKLLG